MASYFKRFLNHRRKSVFSDSGLPGKKNKIIYKKYLQLTIIFMLFFILNSFLYSAPRYFVPITVTQPNGEIINCFASGDEFYNWVHDKDNYTIVKDRKTGYFVYASKVEDELVPTNFVVGKVNPAITGLEKGINISGNKISEIRQTIMKKYDVGNSTLKSAAGFSNINNIVIFIRFSNETAFAENEKIVRYDSAFNDPLLSSMYNYFQETSYKQLTINTTFYPKSTDIVLSYQDSHPRGYFMPYDSASNPAGYIQVNPNDSWGPARKDREMQLLSDAIDFVRPQIPTDLNLDANNDGRVDNVCFIISGNTTAWSTLLWPHRWSLNSKTVMVNNKRVWDFNFQIRSMADVGTLCHEMFHTLGAPDLYHYTNQGVIQPFGVWDLMDNGNAHMCAYMKMKYGGWLTEIPEISESGTYTLSSLVTSKNCAYKIKSTVSDSEFFVVEYRRKAGNYESKLPGHGLLIYRINTLHKGNSSGPPDEVYLYRPDGTPKANGKQALAHFNLSEGRSVFNKTSNPYCFMTDGSLGDLEITVGTPVNPTKTSSTISFTYTKPVLPRSDYAAATNSYSWIDISKTGTLITNWKNGKQPADSAKDDGYTPNAIPLGFDFSFYGEKYNYLYAGINGLVSFTQKILNTAAENTTTPDDYTGFYDDAYNWPGNIVFPNSIAVCYADLDLNPNDSYGGGRVYYATQNNKFILSYENVGTFEKKGDTTNSFQLILDKNTNSVTVQIKKIGLDDTRNKVKIGIQKDNKTGLSWVNAGDPSSKVPPDQTAIVFSLNTTGVNTDRSTSIGDYRLNQNYPNPFNPVTTISYNLPGNSHVNIKIYDILGREIRTLVNENKSAGIHNINLDGTHLTSGIYFYTLKTSSTDGKQNYSETKKMILMK